MAQFCTKCGTQLADGLVFCTGCGATIGGPATPGAQVPAVQAPVTAVAQPPAAYAPAAQAPVVQAASAPAPSSGSPVVKIVLIVLGVLILLGLLSIGSCVYFVYRTKQRVTQFEKQVHASFPTVVPPGQAPGQPAAPVIDMGVPVYPGATAVEGGGQMSLGVGGLKVQQYTSDDSLDKVVAFYKDKLGPQAMVTQSGTSALVQVVGSNGVVNVAIATDSSSGKTKITINSITK